MPLTYGGVPIDAMAATSPEAMPAASLGDMYSGAALPARQTVQPVASPDGARPMPVAPSGIPPQTSGWKAPATAAVAGQAADLGSTAAALRNPNVREANPTMSQNPAIQALVKAGYSVAAAYAIKKLADSGHGTAAKIMGYALGGVGGAAAIHNMSVASKAPGR